MGLQDSKAAATAIIAFENMMQNAEMQRQERKRKKGWIRGVYGRHPTTGNNFSWQD
jgi:hypothetical protein